MGMLKNRILESEARPGSPPGLLTLGRVIRTSSTRQLHAQLRVGSCSPRARTCPPILADLRQLLHWPAGWREPESSERDREGRRGRGCHLGAVAGAVSAADLPRPADGSLPGTLLLAAVCTALPWPVEPVAGSLWMAVLRMACARLSVAEPGAGPYAEASWLSPEGSRLQGGGPGHCARTSR